MISIIIPVYKVEKYIGACINSVLDQSYKDYEIILVDDGSPDESITIAEELLRSRPGIDFKVIHTDNLGVSSARNTGIKASSGDYLIMIDSDDILVPDFLSTYVEMISEAPEYDIYSSGFQVVKEGETYTEQQTNPCRNIYNSEMAQELFFSRKVVFLLPTLLLRRSFVFQNGLFFDEDVRYSEDVQYIWKCLCMNKSSVLHSEKKGYIYNLHGGSTMTSSNEEKISTGFDGLFRLFPLIQPHLTRGIERCFVSMYCFNLLHGASHIIDYDGYKYLYVKYQLKKHYRILIQGGECINHRVKAISYIASIVPFIGYQIMSKF